MTNLTNRRIPVSAAIARTALCAAAILAFAASTGCGRRPAAAPREAAPEPVAVHVAPVQRRTVPRGVDVTGTLFGNEEATISAKVPGRVEAIAHDVGDVVESGGELARIERTEYELAREQKRTAMLESLASLGLSEMPAADFDPAEVPTVVKAKLQSANAEARFRRAERLWAQQPPLISEQDYTDLRTAWDVARSDYDVTVLAARATLAVARSREADLAIANQRLDDTVVRVPRVDGPSPVSPDQGTDRALRYAVAARLASVGEYLNIGAPMFRVVAADPIKFRGDAPERFVGQIRVGQPVSLRAEAFDEPFAGTVVRVNPQVSPRSRTFQVEIEVPNADGRLRPGAFGRAAIVMRDEVGVPFVPESAVIVFAGVTKVFSVRDGKAVEHRVEVGQRASGLVELVGAPRDLDRVIVRGAQRLAGGVPVRESAADAPMTP